jgi:hypothetical protein
MILSKIRILPQERFDLEDLNALLSAARSDSKYQTKKFLSNLNYVINGFTVSGIGLKSATVNMSDGTLIIPQNSNDFSWYTTAPSDPNVIIPDADLVDGTRSYVEMELLTENNTSVTRAFWDPEANGGAGLEFNQIVDTIQDLTIKFVVSTGGFSGSNDRLPLCMIDTDSTGVIKQILDERRLFHRLGTPSNPHNTFAWGSKQEPAYTMNLTATTGIFQAGEIINIGTEIATVVNGGTTSISFMVPSSKNFFPGNAVSGLTSGATGTVDTVFEAFTGVDKSVKSVKEDLDALKTEILLLKTNSPTGFWWQSTRSITQLQSDIDATNAVLDKPSYDEDLVTGVVYNQGDSITLPVDHRTSGSPQMHYTVGKGALEVYLNGQRLSQNVAGGWAEVGSSGSPSMTITIDQALEDTDIIGFRLGLGGAGVTSGGGGGGGSSPAGDFNTLPASATADNSDYIAIYDTSIAAYRKQLRSTFLAGLGNNHQVNTYSANHNVDGTTDDVCLMNVGSSNKTFSLPDPTTVGGKELLFKKIDAGLFSMIVNGAGFLIDGQPSISTNTQWQSVTLIADAAGAQWISK